MIWFTADLHFYHKNVIEYCKRPFASLEEMHEKMWTNFERMIKPDDVLFLLGDICFGGTTKTQEALSRIPGQKRMIIGNHDRQHKPEKWLQFGIETCKTKERMRIGVESVWLSHYPYKSTEPDARTFEDQLELTGQWLIHGHVHQHWKIKDKMINVGVDVWDFKPVSMDQIREIIK